MALGQEMPACDKCVKGPITLSAVRAAVTGAAADTAVVAASRVDVANNAAFAAVADKAAVVADKAAPAAGAGAAAESADNAAPAAVAVAAADVADISTLFTVALTMPSAISAAIAAFTVPTSPALAAASGLETSG